MRAFFKKNIVLLFGLALPLLLVGFFFLAGQIGKTTVPIPEYDLVFAVDYYKNNGNRPWDINLESGKLVLRKRNVPSEPYTNLPRLYMFDRKSLSVRQMDLDFDKTKDGVLVSPLIEALNKKTLLPGPVAPDGYRFEYFGSSGSGFLGEFFGMSHRDWTYALTKESRLIPLRERNIYNAELIAWVGESKP